MFGTLHAKLAALALGLALVIPAAAQALDWPAFTREAFLAAQAEGQTIFIAVHADWCSTCRSQEPALEAVMAEEPFKGVAVFRVDYDAQRDVMFELNVFARSTLIVYRGAEELGRAIAINQLDQVRDLFQLGL